VPGFINEQVWNTVKSSELLEIYTTDISQLKSLLITS